MTYDSMTCVRVKSKKHIRENPATVIYPARSSHTQQAGKQATGRGQGKAPDGLPPSLQSLSSSGQKSGKESDSLGEGRENDAKWDFTNGVLCTFAVKEWGGALSNNEGSPAHLTLPGLLPAAHPRLDEFLAAAYAYLIAHQ